MNPDTKSKVIAVFPKEYDQSLWVNESGSWDGQIQRRKWPICELGRFNTKYNGKKRHTFEKFR